MNFLAIIRSRPLSGLLCLLFSISSFIWLKLDAINDYELNPIIVLTIATVGLLFFIIRQQGLVLLSICFVALFSGTWSVLNLIHSFDKGVVMGLDAWFLVSALWFITWNNLVQLSALKTKNKLIELSLNIVIPVLFGAWIFFLWEVITIGMSVPQVLLPAPSLIWQVFDGFGATLFADFYQTFVRSAIPGFIMGSGAGFLVAIAADKIPFLRRGLIPIGNFFSAIPIIGMAPIMTKDMIMIMWFGFDWQSKAAVVAVMTFFPMMVNTLGGLNETDRIDRDLLHTYASSYWRELFSLRLPNAMPFILNALKINSTLAMIGAIVAEFFGTPIVGMGFRISAEVGRMNIDIVWATIAVAALTGSMFYGVFALLERKLTFWHPSMRKS
jgi:NitT/TauT family transport system permease protein